jgi:hypothetical protein
MDLSADGATETPPAGLNPRALLRQSTRNIRRVVPVITKAPPPEAHGAGAPIRVLQWNILADGLSDDGFLVRGEDANDAAQQDARIEKIMARVREAKSSGDQREAKMLAVSGSALN